MNGTDRTPLPQVPALAAVAMVAGPLLVATADLISPIDTSSDDSSAERLADILHNSGRYNLTVTCLLVGMMLLVPAVLATRHTVDATGRRLAGVGATVAATGFVLFAVNIGAIGIGPTAWASLSDGAQDAAAPAFTAIDEGKGMMPIPIVGSFLLPLVGLPILAVALWRASRLPRWAVVALPLGWVLFLFGPSTAVRATGALVSLAAFAPIVAARISDATARRSTT
ncbi:MAG: hypothetical protein ACRD2C_20640 [Acidimicrobiales bacterium]